jgi:hypothetical protein
MATARYTAKLERLRVLEGAAQIDYAVRLAQSEKHAELLEAAFDVLVAAQHPDLRSLLLAAYAACEGGEGRSDSGCHLRTSLLQRLRPLARLEDRGLLEHALLTYEFVPPGRRWEVAANLRAQALVVLNDLDPALAGYHAVHLLNDSLEHTSEMSGEPAVTAAQVLAAQGQTLPLYAYALREAPGRSEVLAECLRNLAGVPASLVSLLQQRYGKSADEIILLGLYDLFLARPADEPFGRAVLEFLATTRLPNLYRYVVSMIVASRRDDLIAPLTKQARNERDPMKKAILDEALALA